MFKVVPPLPKLKVQYIAIVGMLGVLAIVLASLTDQSRTRERIFHELFLAVGSLLVALTIGGGLLRWWQARKWRELTQELTYDLLEQAMWQTANIAAGAFHVLGKSDAVSGVEYAYRLPWTDERQAAAKDLQGSIPQQLLASFEEGQTSRELVERVTRAAPQLESRADRLRELALELGAYIEEDPIGLATDVVELHRSARTLVPLGGYENVPQDLSTPLAGLTASSVLGPSIVVAGRLAAEYARLRKRPIPDPHLREMIEQHEAEIEEEDRSEAEMRRTERELEELSVGINETVASLQEGQKELLKNIDALLERNPSPETLETISKGLGDSSEALDRAHRPLTEDASPESTQGFRGPADR